MHSAASFFNDLAFLSLYLLIICGTLFCSVFAIRMTFALGKDSFGRCRHCRAEKARQGG